MLCFKSQKESIDLYRTERLDLSTTGDVRYAVSRRTFMIVDVRIYSDLGWWVGHQLYKDLYEFFDMRDIW